MGIKFTNNASGTLGSNIIAGDVTIPLTAGNGALFPVLGAGDYFYATIIDASLNREIIKVTARATDTLTAVRGQDGTTARAYSTGDRIELRVTNAGMLAVISEVMLSAWSTGDAKLTLKTVADSGWVMCNDGTIGNAASGGTTRANADTVALFTLLWTNVADAQAPVSTGRGGSAAADYAAGKTIGLTKMLGRAIAIAGAGAGLTARVLGLAIGDENLQSHLHAVNINSGGQSASHTHPIPILTIGGSGGAGQYVNGGSGTIDTQAASNDHTHNVSGNTATTGTGAAQNMQPSGFLNAMIKL